MEPSHSRHTTGSVEKTGELFHKIKARRNNKRRRSGNQA
jgi:hypothetical protein